MGRCQNLVPGRIPWGNFRVHRSSRGSFFMYLHILFISRIRQNSHEEALCVVNDLATNSPLFLFPYSLVTPISQSINPNHLLRLFSAGILWRQLLVSLLFFVQVCFRLIQQLQWSLYVRLPSAKLRPSYPSISTLNQVFHHTNLPFASVTLLSLDKHHVFLLRGSFFRLMIEIVTLSSSL